CPDPPNPVNRHHLRRSRYPNSPSAAVGPGWPPDGGAYSPRTRTPAGREPPDRYKSWRPAALRPAGFLLPCRPPPDEKSAPAWAAGCEIWPIGLQCGRQIGTAYLLLQLFSPDPEQFLRRGTETRTKGILR